MRGDSLIGLSDLTWHPLLSNISNDEMAQIADGMNINRGCTASRVVRNPAALDVGMVRDGQATGGENTRAGTRPTLRGSRRPNSETDTLHTAESVPLDEAASIPESVTEDEERSSARSRNVRPYNSHFRMLVLAPCKIDILDTFHIHVWKAGDEIQVRQPAP